MVPLPPAESTADYATGFASDGVAAFSQLAYIATTELGPAHVVKFVILDIQTDPRVYFQNTRRHRVHYDFARRILGVALSGAEFAARTYAGADRWHMAGTLLFYPELVAPGGQTAPVVLSFMPSDDLTPAQAARAHTLLEERMGFVALEGAERRLVYVPSGERQTTAAIAASADLAAAEVAWARLEDLAMTLREQFLNDGVAYGVLRRLTPEELLTAPVSFGDILVLPRLPNELPIVGGTISEEFQTPLSHVNVAARTRGTPNLALRDATTDPRLVPHFGALVRFEVRRGAFTLAPTTLAEAEAFWQSRAHEPFVPTADLSRTDILPFADIGFHDAAAVGVKAANVAELHRLLPNVAPDGFAVPFAAYDTFLRTAQATAAGCEAAFDDCRDEGRDYAVCFAARATCFAAAAETTNLRDFARHVLGDPAVWAATPLREACLDGLRHLMRNAPVAPEFAAALDGAVAAAFGTARVRLRSSTNAEDLEAFSGAGLYTSVGAFATGDERASRQIRKVWASVFNFRAHEERTFWNIDHFAVQMGVCVHRAFPDEQANGVFITQNVADPTVAGIYVNVQLGEVAVTNPEGGAIPEIFAIVAAPRGGIQVARRRYSSLSPETPILTDAEVAALHAAATATQNHFAALYGESPYALALDGEFKFHGPARELVVKQIRPYTVAP